MWNWYLDNVVDTGRSAALWLLIGFLVSYGVTRAITVRIRRRRTSGTAEESGPIKDVHIGGVHVHHQVWGILLVLVVGLLTYRFRPESPWIEVLATLFGVGAALALDEFALWLHLEDVYWSEEGKKSIDAVMLAVVFGLVLLVGTSPLGIESDEAAASGVWITAAAVLGHVGISVICMLKGKLVVGLAGLPLPTVSFLGAVRLAKPDSFWARRFYGEKKLARASSRHARVETRRLALRDRLFGG
jgi:F0F1-type ATP synthase assembly protein I